jgi:leucyl-tRNA synthetase
VLLVSAGPAPRHLEVEAKWRARWESEALFARRRPDLPKWYVMELPPFATGSLHLGHARNYVLADAGVRFRRMAGYDVLYTTGYDTFGLPSELAAREAGIHPAELAERCCAQMGEQLRRLGLSHDPTRITAYHSPDYYRWVQWVFLRLLAAGFCERREGPVLWCPDCDASVTESLVENGRCWRCRAAVERRLVPQWFVHEQVFADAMLDGMSELPGWPDTVLKIHRDWIGRRGGMAVDLEVEGRPDSAVTVFVEKGGTLAAAAAIGIAEDHPLLAGGARPSLRHAALDGPLPLLGLAPQWLPAPDAAIPLVPGANAAHDRALAEANVPARAVGGRAEPAGRPETIYRLQDWGIARQRYWGPPVPIVHCPVCGPVPVAEEDLPVLLPQDVSLDGASNPLASDAAFLAAACPACGAAGQRDSDTFEAYSSPWWYHWACREPGDPTPFEAERAERWLPVDVMIGGADQIRSCFFHIRMIARALQRLGIASVEEPVATLIAIGMVQAEGRKMSKTAGNSVDLPELLDTHGADVVRLAVLRAAAPDRDFNWSPALVARAEGFLVRVARLARSPALQPRSAAEDGSAPGPLARKLAGWTRTAAYKVTSNLVQHQYHLAVQNLEFLFDRLRHVESGIGEGAADRAQLRDSWQAFLRLLAPAAPHLAEELWSQAGGQGLVAEAPWPAPLEEARQRPSRHSHGRPATAEAPAEQAA